jgi:hypothetical protein
LTFETVDVPVVSVQAGVPPGFPSIAIVPVGHCIQALVAVFSAHPSTHAKEPVVIVVPVNVHVP